MQVNEQDLDSGVPGELRTEEAAKQQHDEIKACKTMKDKTETSRKYGIHAVRCPLWNFHFADRADKSSWQHLLSPYKAFTYEGMHNDDSGVFPYMIKNLAAVIHARKTQSDDTWTQAKTNNIMRVLLERMRSCPPATDFHLPIMGGKYFTEKPGRVQAREQKNVMQVRPFTVPPVVALGWMCSKNTTPVL